MKNRMPAMLLCLVLVLGLLAGCSGTTAADPTATTQPTVKVTDAPQATATAQPPEETALVPFSETFEFNVMMYDRQPFAEKPVVWDALQEMTNTKINFSRTTSANYTEKLNTTLAGGDLPELIYMSSGQMVPFMEAGALLPLNDLLDEYGADIVRHYSEDDWNYFRSLSIDENLYYLQGIYGGVISDKLLEISSLGIRSDWLADLGLEYPATLQQWEDTLITFRDEDPAGKGTTIPFAGTLAPIADAFGILGNARWQVWEGEYMSKYDTPHFLDYLEIIRRWYAEKLYDQEYLTRDSTAQQELFNIGVAGAGQHAADRLRLMTIAAREGDEDAYYQPVVPIIGPYGHQIIQGRGQYNTGFAITVKAETLGVQDKIMQYVNWTFSDDGCRLLNFGIEGVHHEIVDGKPELIPPYNEGWEAKRTDGMNPLMMAFIWDINAYNDSLFRGKTADELDEYERINYIGLFSNTQYTITPTLTFVTPVDQEKGTDLWSFLEEKETNVILGQITIEDFAAALTEVRDDLDAITAEKKAIYDQYFK